MEEGEEITVRRSFIEVPLQEGRRQRQVKRLSIWLG